MSCFTVLYWSIIAIDIIVVSICILDLLLHTKVLSDYLYMRKRKDGSCVIYQRTINSYFASYKTRAKFRDSTIKEEIKEYNKLFRADFETLFDKLKPHIRYRVTTHYADVVNKAAADGKIRLLEEPRFDKKRTLTEMKPLLGRRDYFLAKKCIRHYPQLIRCCENCARKTKCACNRGGVCAVSFEKIFFTFVFEKLDVQ